MYECIILRKKLAHMTDESSNLYPSA